MLQHHITKTHKLLHTHKSTFTKMVKATLWFSFGGLLGFFFFVSFLYISYKNAYDNRAYIGVMVDGVHFAGKSKEEIKEYFAQKNAHIQKNTVTLTSNQIIATVSAKKIDFGYKEELLAEQALSVGRSGVPMADMSIILQAYAEGIRLPASYNYDEKIVNNLLAPLQKKLDRKPIDPVFTIENEKVVTFKLPKDGQAVDTAKIQEAIFVKLSSAALTQKAQHMTMAIPLKEVEPNHTNEGGDLGIKELIAQGNSLFQGSIENRVFNIGLAASRLNGVLIPPGEVFSFNKTVGDISTFTGYRQAYVIQNGKTVLGDGGGVCQVSTTLFRAALNAGLPIIERNQHAYRVGYYEQDLGPGIDAAIYSPSVDLKFKNDTGNHILIQTSFSPATQSLTFSLYGTKDDREVIIGKPVILGETPAPEPLFQDDPNVPKGQVKQIDFAATGANVFFTRTVKKDDKIISSDKFASHYRPWQAIYVRGTKE